AFPCRSRWAGLWAHCALESAAGFRRQVGICRRMLSERRRSRSEFIRRPTVRGKRGQPGQRPGRSIAQRAHKPDQRRPKQTSQNSNVKSKQADPRKSKARKPPQRQHQSKNQYRLYIDSGTYIVRQHMSTSAAAPLSCYPLKIAIASNTPPLARKSYRRFSPDTHYITEDILINVTPFETRVAIVAQGVVQELHVERSIQKGYVGNIYQAKVVRVLPGMQSAFI